MYRRGWQRTLVCYFQDMSNECPSDGCQPLQAPAAFLCQIQGVKAVSQNNHFQQIDQLIHVQLAL